MPRRTPQSKKRTALLRMLKPVFRSHRSRPVAEVIARIIRPRLGNIAAGYSSRCFAYPRPRRRRFGPTWHARASVAGSAGSGGAQRGCMGRSAFSPATESPLDVARQPPQTERLITLGAKRCRSA
jgi:hypothetical protein